MNIAANANSTIATVPEMICPKYKPAITAAIMMRIILSAVPIFFFMINNFVIQRSNT